MAESAEEAYKIVIVDALCHAYSRSVHALMCRTSEEDLKAADEAIGKVRELLRYDRLLDHGTNFMFWEMLESVQNIRDKV